MPPATTSANASITAPRGWVSASASLSASALLQQARTPVRATATTAAAGALASTFFSIAPPEVYTSRFTTSLTADITSGLRPTVISVAATQPGFGSGTFSIAIYDVGTESNPVNFESLEVTGGGASLNWTVVTETGWNALAHVTGSTVVATVLTPRSITQPLTNHTNTSNTPDPHSIYLRKGSYLNKGDLVVGTGGSGQFTPLAVGTDGQILTADSTQQSGVRWFPFSITSVLQHMGDLITGGVLGVAQRLGIGSIGQVLGIVQNAPLIADPLTAPFVFASGSGGALVNGNFYYFSYAWQYPNSPPDGGGITLPSPLAPGLATATGCLSVRAPVAPVAGAALVIYGSLGGVPPYYQQGVLSPASTTSLNIVQISGMQTSGPVPNTTNTTGGIGPGWVPVNTVSSVGLGMPSDFSVANSPLTGPGSLVVTRNAQSMNTVLAGPSSGAVATPTYRTLVAADLPSPLVLPGQITASYVQPTGSVGTNVGSARLVGSTPSGAPKSGTWLLGDVVVDDTGFLWICTVGGSPGTWANTAVGAARASLGATASMIALVPAGASFGPSGPSHAAGFVPDPGSAPGNTHFLCEDTSWRVPVFGSSASPYINIQEQQTAGTDGGTATSGSFFTRTLNTIASDLSSVVVSLSSNQFTIPSGTYRIRATIPGSRVDRFTSRLQNITDATTTLFGTSTNALNSAAYSQTTSEIVGKFQITSNKAFAIQMRVQTTQAATLALGAAANMGQTEIYTNVELWKEA